MRQNIIAPGTFDVYIMFDRGHPLELVWRHMVPGLGLVETSLNIIRSGEKLLLKMIRERSIYIGQDAHGTPTVTLRLSEDQATELAEAFERAQRRRKDIYERPIR